MLLKIIAGSFAILQFNWFKMRGFEQSVFLDIGPNAQ